MFLKAVAKRKWRGYAIYMKQSLSIVIGLIIIAVVIFFALQYSNTGQDAVTSPSPVVTQNQSAQTVPSTLPDVSPSPSSTAKTMAISIDDQGFTPSTVTIAAGTTVVFTNNGQALHWPASDPHPIHTDLSGFDARKGLTTGESYSFTFSKTGTFGMHDHLNSSMKGTIVVK